MTDLEEGGFSPLPTGHNNSLFTSPIIRSAGSRRTTSSNSTPLSLFGINKNPKQRLLDSQLGFNITGNLIRYL